METQQSDTELAAGTQELLDPRPPSEARAEHDAKIAEGSDPVAAVVAEPVAIEATEEIRIHDRTFTNQAEAFAYAEQLAQNQAAQDSYQQGMQDAISQQSNVTPAAEPPVADNFDERFYGDPNKYLTEEITKAKQSAKDEVMAAVRAEQAETKAWTDFYKQNPDLENKDEVVKMFVKNHWDKYRLMETGQAFKLIASGVRTQIKQWVEDSLPQKEMPNTASPVSSGSQSNVTPAPVAEEALDFISQVNKIQSKRFRPI